MRNRIALLIFLLFLNFSINDKEGDLAVFEINKGEGVPATVNTNFLTNLLREIAGRLTNYRVMTRENIWAIIQDKGIDPLKCADEKGAVECGRVLQADKVVVGSLNFIEGIYYLNLSLYDSSSATLERSVSRKCDGCSFKKLTEMLEESAKELFQGKIEIEISNKELSELQMKCDIDGDFEACLNLFNHLLMRGSDEEKRYFKKLTEMKGKEFYYEGCNNGNAFYCFILGRMYHSGKGIEKNTKTAVTLYKKSCDMENALGCNSLGVMYAMGTGIDKDSKIAVTLYKKACDMGNASGCHNLGWMYEIGEG